MMTLSKLLFLILMGFTMPGLIISEACTIIEAKNSLTLAIKVLDLFKENNFCHSSNISKPDPVTHPCKFNPSNCAEILALGFTTNGVYKVYPKWQKNGKPFDVFCDQENDGGGWTVFQRRGDYGVNFYRNWTEYKNGFGNLTQEFWLGNDYLNLLTTQDRMELKIDLEDFENEKRYAIYTDFLVLDETKSYLMTFSNYDGDAGNAMARHNGKTFVTMDRGDVNACASTFKGAWWYATCHAANLNGLYLKGTHGTFADGVNWQPFKGYHYSLKTTVMKIRPQFFEKHFVKPHNFFDIKNDVD